MSNPPVASSAPLNELLEGYADVFDAVDSLQEAGLERELIPKLVVVGDPSSGKSSVLEAICKIPFPVHEDLCTRFPIELVQRKSELESITITISVIEKGLNDNALIGFKKELFPLDPEGLRVSIKEASKLILGTPNAPSSHRQFSRNILRITILGPEKHPLTLVDLPGFFQSSTDTQSEKDRHVVEEIVAPYLREPRNGLLLIMRGSTTWATQTAPSQVACPDVDPAGKRTLGIFTHLDNIDSSRLIMDRFNGRTKWNPRYGWHALKNLSDEERQKGHNRDEVERKFFAKGWPQIDSSCKGVVNLRPRLSEVLAKQIRIHLGDLISEVKSEIKSLSLKIDKLGKKRTTEQEQRNYLSQMAGHFQELCTNAVSGRYGEGTASKQLQQFFYDPEDSEQRSQDKRLQAVTRALGQLFVSVMIERGKKTELDESDPGKKVPWSGDLLDRLSEIEAEAAAAAAEVEAAESEAKLGTSEAEAESEAAEADAPESEYNSDDGPGSSAPTFLREEILNEYNSFSSPVKISFNEFQIQVLAKAVRWRGTESLDDVNPAMVSHLYRDQTSRWRSIAHRHLEFVWDSVTRFVNLALKHCVDSSLLQSLEDLIIKDRLDKLRLSTEAKLEELLACHEGTNPAFHDFLREFQDESLEFSNRIAPNSFYAKRTLAKRVEDTLSSGVFELILERACRTIGWKIKPMDEFADFIMSRVKEVVSGSTFNEHVRTDPSSRYLQDKERGAVRRNILMIERYYKLSLISFISYVNAMVIHNGLLDRVPYEIFSHNIVSEQTAKTIADIAGEKKKDARQRLDCEKKLQILKQSLHILETFRIN
ncbi:hypothetical protein ACKRZS_007834 [Fusarium odoratissimum]